jgi:hypothetical protein
VQRRRGRRVAQRVLRAHDGALLAATPDAPQRADWYDHVYTEEVPAWVRARYAFLAQPAP